MTAFKGTPGPWIVDAYGDVTANGEDVARIASSGEEAAAADARLIAAAPDLLEALQDLMPAFESRLGDFENAEWNDCWNKAVAAIAKAIGEQP